MPDTTGQHNILEPTIFPSRDRTSAVMAFPDGSQQRILLDHIQDAIEALGNVQATLAREDCMRIVGVDGDFQRVFEGGEG
jgi:hypothetical protein